MNTSSSFSGEEARQLPVPKKPEYKDTKDALSGLLTMKRSDSIFPAACRKCGKRISTPFS